METSRLETFADGVFAIAATLLIIYVSADAPGGGLGPALQHHWPQYAAYLVTFVTIGIWWVNHHLVMTMIGRADRAFLFANIALLACIAFLPYPTKLVAEHFRDNGARAAVLTYGLTMTAAALCFSLVWFYAAMNRRLIAESVDQRMVDHITHSIIPGVPINVGATLLALWSPHAAIALFVALTLFYVAGATLLEPKIETAGELA
ncbi:MAG TPA: TMEM175 family protein [Gaiellaceae bacterium]|nr:TMEM175 family protein [Gaiellaceae bacterium]